MLRTKELETGVTGQPAPSFVGASRTFKAIEKGLAPFPICSTCSITIRLATGPTGIPGRPTPIVMNLADFESRLRFYGRNGHMKALKLTPNPGL